jgi:hypothetical protein
LEGGEIFQKKPYFKKAFNKKFYQLFFLKKKNSLKQILKLQQTNFKKMNPITTIFNPPTTKVTEKPEPDDERIGQCNTSSKV